MPGQIDVHQDEIGLQVVGHRDRVLTGLGLADDLEPVGELHDHAGREPERLLVINDQHANGHQAPSASSLPNTSWTWQ